MGDWETDGCSLIKPGDQVVMMREIGSAFRNLGITRVDLMLINIEGYEYTLIPHMLDRGILPDRLMVQCHGDDAATAELFDRIERAGYRMAWTYGAVLTAWERT